MHLFHDFVLNIPSGKLTPWQLLGLEDSFPLKIGDFQGRTVYFPEGH